MQSVVWNEALKINGADPDFHRRDLWDAIQTGRLPGMGARPAAVRRGRSPTSSTSTCSTRPRSSPRRRCPVRRVGRLVLDRVVDNFFAETEQVAFCTQNIVPGIDFTNDPLLQGRNFSYLDTQLKRLGSPNFTYLPINAPKCPFHHFQQDGHMAMRNPEGPRQLRAELLGRAAAARARRRTRASTSFPARGARARSCASARRPSPTITARRGSSTSARRRSSRATSPPPSSSS